MSALVEFQQVWKGFSGRVVLRDVSFSLDASQVVAVTGPNGAGKTTLFRLLAGVSMPDKGKVVRSSKSTGYLAHEPMFFGELTVQQHLDFWGFSTSDYALELIERFGLTRFKRKAARTLSQGYRQMLATVQACGHQPDLLVLDEPAVALDTGAREKLAATVKEATDRGACIVLSEHRDLKWANPTDRLYVADGGASLQ